MEMSPCTLEVLIHCHTTPMKHPRMDAPAVNESYTALFDAGLIKVVDETDETMYYVTTKRGACHMKQLCNLRLPIMQWIGANGESITT